MHVFDAAAHEYVHSFGGTSHAHALHIGKPRAMCVDGADLYVCDEQSHRVIVADAATGEARVALGVRNDAAGFMWGMCVDADAGEVFVADSDARRVLVFATM